MMDVLFGIFIAANVIAILLIMRRQDIIGSNAERAWDERMSLEARIDRIERNKKGK